MWTNLIRADYSSDPDARQLIAKLLTEWDGPISVEDLAELAELSAKHVSDLLRASNGTVARKRADGLWESASIKFDVDQARVIEAPSKSRLLVIAGPGAGKTEIACGRVVRALANGLTGPSILLISFTRAATAEMRDRIQRLADNVDTQSVRTVDLRTLDSLAWTIQEKDPSGRFTGGFDESVQRAIAALACPRPELTEYMSRLRLVLIDEAQDVVGIRSSFVEAFVKSLGSDCGVTVFADPAQAIYGWTLDTVDRTTDQKDLLELINDSDLQFETATLNGNYRTSEGALRRVADSLRPIALNAADGEGAYRSFKRKLTEHIGSKESGNTVLRDLASGNPSAFFLFRLQAEAAEASSILNELQVAHRLRLSKISDPVYPWIGRLLSEFTSPRLTRKSFDLLWRDRIEGSAFEEAFEADTAWTILDSEAGDGRSIDMSTLRAIVSRQQPPDEMKRPWVGTEGPLLSTIHSAKGREAEEVTVLFGQDEREPARKVDYAEEQRVLYVAATRARENLQGLKLTETCYHLASGRGWRFDGWNGQLVQFGMDRDLDPLSPVSQTIFQSDPEEPWRLQRLFAQPNGKKTLNPVEWLADRDDGWTLKMKSGGMPRLIGAPSPFFDADRRELNNKNNGETFLANRQAGLHIVDFRTVAREVGSPDLNHVGDDYAESGFWVAPVVTGFTGVKSNRKG